MKLNDEAPEQHIAIIVLGGLFLLINLVAAWKAQHKGAVDANGTQQTLTQMVDEQGNVSEQPTLHQNPTLSWSELIFCRGLKRSAWCSDRERHPDTVDAEELGVAVVTEGRKQDHVVAYRGPMHRDSMFSSHVSIPEQDVSNKYWDIASTAEEPAPQPTNGQQ